MPAQLSFLERLPAILAEARAPKPIPFFRRRDIEVLFGLKRRRAIYLMHLIGAVRVSSEIAVEQKDLVKWLERVAEAPETSREAARRDRVIGEIVSLKAETRARSVRITLPDPPPVAGLPDGVALEPGRLTVSFASGEQLLERLFGLARVLAADPARLDALGR